ncbi:hypothetical protein MTO96_005154 [Rhipicephalus appendiculatus]
MASSRCALTRQQSLRDEDEVESELVMYQLSPTFPFFKRPCGTTVSARPRPPMGTGSVSGGDGATAQDISADDDGSPDMMTVGAPEVGGRKQGEMYILSCTLGGYAKLH